MDDVENGFEKLEKYWQHEIKRYIAPSYSFVECTGVKFCEQVNRKKLD